jgi:hypothetical protein
MQSSSQPVIITTTTTTTIITTTTTTAIKLKITHHYYVCVRTWCRCEVALIQVSGNCVMRHQAGQVGRSDIPVVMAVMAVVVEAVVAGLVMVEVAVVLVGAW